MSWFVWAQGRGWLVTHQTGERTDPVRLFATSPLFALSFLPIAVESLRSRLHQTSQTGSLQTTASLLVCFFGPSPCFWLFLLALVASMKKRKHEISHKSPDFWRPLGILNIWQSSQDWATLGWGGCPFRLCVLHLLRVLANPPLRALLLINFDHVVKMFTDPSHLKTGPVQYVN